MLNIILRNISHSPKVLWLILMFSSSQLFSQLLMQGPEGDVTIMGSMQPYTNLTVSATNVQIITKYKYTSSGRVITGYWSPPEGSYITYVKYKQVPDPNNSGSFNEKIIVLLDNGSVVILDALNLIAGGSGKPVHFNAPNIHGSVDYKKIDGDALYILSTSGTYVSRDSGSTWQIDTTGIGTTRVWDIAVDSSQFVYAAADNGFYIQSPDSNVWRQIKSNTFGYYNSFTKVFIDRKNRIFLGANGGGIYLSTDNGSTWSIDTTGIDYGFQSINAFGDDYFGNVYAALSNSTLTSNAIFKSSGGNSNWTRIDQGITQLP